VAETLQPAAGIAGQLARLAVPPDLATGPETIIDQDDGLLLLGNARCGGYACGAAADNYDVGGANFKHPF
jgi:hypothetical protein